MIKGKGALAVVVTVLLLAGASVVASRAVSNGWSLLTGRGYVIPAESSLFAFDATVMNKGSGEWWLYGEDGRYYYHFTGSGAPPYLKIDRAAAERCRGFDRHREETWRACTAG